MDEILLEFLDIKNSNNIKSPVDNMLDMCKSGNYNMEKVYDYLIDRNADRYVVELIKNKY